MGNSETVAIVITTYNDPGFLAEAIASAVSQHRPASEVFVVDDGSAVSPASVLANFPQVVLLRKRNGGPSSARNLGLQHARSKYITFLDADDRLTPNMISASLGCFADHPEAAMVYGAHRRIGASGKAISRDSIHIMGTDPYADLLTGNRIGMHATVLYKRGDLLEIGGFDESLRRSEDYDVYLRLAKRSHIASHPETVAEYRWHGNNASTDRSAMLSSALAVHERHRDQPPARRAAWHKGQRNLLDWYHKEQRDHWNKGKSEKTLSWRTRRVIRSAARRIRRFFRHGRLHRMSARIWPMWPPPLGMINFGMMADTRPVSMDFGWDRGTPVDRFYIEEFLRTQSNDIYGRVLEIGDDMYSRQFGAGRITHQDVLHLHTSAPKVTIVGDMTHPGVLPVNTFDCMILTQVFQYIFDVEQAIAHLYSALKPGGILLLTVPGITQIDRGEWGERWCWSFTAVSIRKLLEACFAPEALSLEVSGNVFSAICHLQGAVLEEIDTAKLHPYDPAYPVVITIRAQKI